MPSTDPDKQNDADAAKLGWLFFLLMLPSIAFVIFLAVVIYKAFTKKSGSSPKL